MVKFCKTLVRQSQIIQLLVQTFFQWRQDEYMEMTLPSSSYQIARKLNSWNSPHRNTSDRLEPSVAD
ncbi:MAG: hypothetical protein MJA27_09095 [Pseudanabaenales cyanobacterium]|nr:hypothetical protein [Pseudanabaenales cyanobacterium]